MKIVGKLSTVTVDRYYHHPQGENMGGPSACLLLRDALCSCIYFKGQLTPSVDAQ